MGFNIVLGCAARLWHVHLLPERSLLLVQHVDGNQPERVQFVSFFFFGPTILVHVLYTY